MVKNVRTHKLNSYLVGGAIRDQLLSRQVIEKDFVVVGSTVEEMLSLGFKQVGKDFPVFLHPETNEEYALARTEKKQGQGYTGFVCHASADVTLEEDLLRRDLTVNAMAMNNLGEIIDPFNGREDLSKKLLRHVSPAFKEDPLRVLRVARFAARYHYLGFTIADETLKFMEEISLSGELLALSSERIWKEMERSLGERNPEVFFQVLYQCKALKDIFPELNNFFDADLISPHILGSEFTNTLKQVIELSNKTSIRFATLCLNLKQTATQHVKGSTLSQESDKNLFIDKICQQLKVPNHVSSIAIKAYKFEHQIHNSLSLNARTILKLLNQLDVWRKPEEFEDVLLACQAFNQPKRSQNEVLYPPSTFLKAIVISANLVTAKPFIEQGIKGKDIKEAIENERIKNIVNIINNYTKV